MSAIFPARILVLLMSGCSFGSGSHSTFLGVKGSCIITSQVGFLVAAAESFCVSHSDGLGFLWRVRDGSLRAAISPYMAGPFVLLAYNIEKTRDGATREMSVDDDLEATDSPDWTTIETGSGNTKKNRLYIILVSVCRATVVIARIPLSGCKLPCRMACRLWVGRMQSSGGFTPSRWP